MGGVYGLMGSDTICICKDHFGLSVESALERSLVGLWGFSHEGTNVGER